jgi:hypothetical protein
MTQRPATRCRGVGLEGRDAGLLLLADHDVSLDHEQIVGVKSAMMQDRSFDTALTIIQNQSFICSPLRWH